MKLWYSTTSPYARKAVVTVKHHGLENSVTLARITASFSPDSPHNRDNPLGRIPALQTDSGEWLYGSLLISEYLDAQGTQATLFPAEHQWQMLNLHALADGIMENTMPMVAEKMLRAESEWWLDRHRQLTDRNRRSFSALAQAIQPFGTALNIGTLTAVSLIDWWQFRHEKTGFNLQDDYPILLDWSAEMSRLYTCLQHTRPQV